MVKKILAHAENLLQEYDEEDRVYSLSVPLWRYFAVEKVDLTEGTEAAEEAAAAAADSEGSEETEEDRSPEKKKRKKV